MSRVTLRPATAEDALWLAPRLRADDLRELRDLARTGPHAALADGLAAGEALTAMWQGEPVAMLGCGHLGILGNSGSPWMLGTDALRRLSLPIVRLGRIKVAEWRQRFALLENVVDGRNEASVAWLRMLGFNFDEPVDVAGAPAIRFWQRGF